MEHQSRMGSRFAEVNGGKMEAEIKKEQLSLKNLYRLLMEDDYPVYSQSVISERNRKGVTLLRFWRETILYEFCTLKYGRIIWRRDGGRNRHLSEVCNRRISLQMCEAYTGEIMEILTPELALKQILQFEAWLRQREFSLELLELRLEKLQEELLSGDGCFSEEIDRFLKENQKMLKENKDYGIQKKEFLVFWKFMILTLHALSGNAMNHMMMQQMRNSGVLDTRILWKKYAEKKAEIHQESRFLTREWGELFHSPLSSGHFFGREEELFELQELCRRGGCYLLSGIGGIGKTELLRQLLRICVKDNLAEQIVVVQYEVSLADSFMTAFPAMKGMEPESALMEIFIKLRQIKDKKLLVLVDNVNRSCEEDPDLKQLQTLPGAVFVTSRLTELDGFAAVHIQVPSRASCKLIFRDNYENCISPEENGYLDQLLEKEIWCHTLTLRLLGRAAKVQGWTVKQLLEQLEKGGSRISWKEESKNIRLKQVYRYMYSLASMTEDEKKILRLWAVFPYKGYTAKTISEYREAGMQKEAAQKSDSLETETEKILEKLWLGGWLEYDSRQGYSMHPFIAECLRSMKALKAQELLELLRKSDQRWMEDMDYNAWSRSIVRPSAKEAELAGILMTASSYLEGAVDGEVMRLVLMAQEIFWREYGVSKASWKQIENLMDRCSEVTDELRVRFYLARARIQWPDMEYNEAEFRRQSTRRTIPEGLYLDFCCAYGMNLTTEGQVDRSDEILKMVLASESTCDQKINSCYYLAANENMRMNMEGMLEWSERGLKMIGDLPEEERPERMHQALLGMKCSACILSGQYGPAQECLMQMELGLSQYDCFEFRYCYFNNVGNLALKTGDGFKAVEYFEKALAEMEICIGGEDFSSYKQRFLLGNALALAGRYEEAMGRYRQALSFFEHMEGMNLMCQRIYNDMGAMYLKWEKPKEALAYLEKGYEPGNAKRAETEALIRQAKQMLER